MFIIENMRNWFNFKIICKEFFDVIIFGDIKIIRRNYDVVLFNLDMGKESLLLMVFVIFIICLLLKIKVFKIFFELEGLKLVDIFIGNLEVDIFIGND